jgi:hypothetical protein
MTANKYRKCMSRHRMNHRRVRSGRVRVLRAVAVYIWIASVACGSSPTAPTPQPPNINGQWSGSYRVLSCSESVPSGACTGLGSGGPHSLTPSQAGSTFTGQLGVGIFSVPVSGSVDASGVVTLAGSGPVSFATLTITAWRGVVSGSTLTGTMSYSVTSGNVIVLVTATTELRR